MGLRRGAIDELTPPGLSKRQNRAVGVLGVAHGDQCVGGSGHLDAVTAVAAAVTGLTPDADFDAATAVTAAVARLAPEANFDAVAAVTAAVLLVSELAANACAHSASGHPGGSFVVRVCGSEPVYVEVEDQGSSWDGTLGRMKSPHGLYLLRELSAACGTRRAAGGWVTWFVLGGSDD